LRILHFNSSQLKLSTLRVVRFKIYALKRGHWMIKALIMAILCTMFVAAASGQTTPKTPSADSAVTCSYYSSKYDGRPTASGQRFSNERLTAASKTYPMGTRLRLTNVKNGRTVVVVVNDRGPSVPGRDISVTRRAAQQLGFVRSGLTQVNMVSISN
jgi:rare lipoprotein A